MAKFKVIDSNSNTHIINALFMKVDINGVLCLYGRPFSGSYKPVASFQKWISAVPHDEHN